MTARPVVAATDGSEDSLRAVEWAAREAVLHGIPLRIVSAASLPKMVVLPLKPERDAVLDFVHDYRDRALAAAAARAAEIAPGLLIDTDPVEGPPAEGHFQLSPSVGDMLRISIFRNTAACRDEFTATNTKTVTVATPCQVIYRHTQPGATLTDISGTWSPPAANVRLWEFRNVAITSTTAPTARPAARGRRKSTSRHP